jgi:hypothetical protein
MTRPLLVWPAGGGPGVPVYLREGVHQAAVEGLLFGRVVVILIGGGGLRAIKAEGVQRAGAVAGGVQGSLDYLSESASV